MKSSLEKTLFWTLAALVALFWLGAVAADAQDAKVFILTTEESQEAHAAYTAAKEAAKHYQELKARLKEKYQFDFEILFSDDFKAIVPSDSQEPWYRGLGPCVIPQGERGALTWPVPIPAGWYTDLHPAISPDHKEVFPVAR